MASGIQSSWAKVVATYQPSTIEFIGTLLVQLFAFWLTSFIYVSLPVLFPSFSERHKLQPANKQPSTREIQHCTLLVLRNTLIAASIHVALLSVNHILDSPPSYRVEARFPPLPEFVRDFIICLLLREAGFYYSHRLLHQPAFYARVHKQHHRFIAPMALAAQYAHPIEHIVANVLPIVVPPKLLHSHILTYFAFLAFMLFETATVHSGYDFFANTAKKHDLHHEKFLLNFGSIGLLDWLHGTDKLRKKDAKYIQ